MERPMSVSTLTHIALGLLALVGAAAIAAAVMLASPVRPPPPLLSIHEGAMQIDPVGAPDLSRFQARDGTWLAYRLYPAANGARGRVAILAHGWFVRQFDRNACRCGGACGRGRDGGCGRFSRPRR